MPNDGPPVEGAPGEADTDQAVLRSRTRLTVRLNTVINRFADRDDLLLYCLWRAPEGGEAPAWYDPRSSEIFVNAHVGLRGADPKDVNPLTRAGRRKHPEIVGLLAHEASHAHSTDTSEAAIAFKEKVLREDPLLLEVFTMLEEPRIEYRQVQRRPHDRYYLRAQSVMIDLAPFALDEEEDPSPELDRWKAAMAALLVYGRVDAGILTSYDAEHARPVLVEALGEEDLERLREVQRRALRVEDGDLEGLLECAREWLGVVGRPEVPEGLEELLGLLAALFGCGGGSGDSEDSEWAEDGADEGSGGGGADGEGSADQDGEGGEEGGGSGGGQVLSGLGEALKSFSEEVSAEVAAEAEAQEAMEAAHGAGKQSAKARSQEAKKTTKQEKVAAAVFDPDTGDAPALRGTRPPTATERRLARTVGTALKRAQFRDRTTTKHTSLTPPGRLNGRDAMLGEAQKSMGNMVTARPFRTTRARHAPEPPITLGLLADYSGSMSWATHALSSVAWIFAHAMTHVEGTMASALFAEKVVPLTRPGERPQRVQEYDATGGWENFGRAYDAINGALHLTRGQGVRLLVVISDGRFVNKDAQEAQTAALADLNRAGVQVLWVGGQGDRFPEGAIRVALDRTVVGASGEELAELITENLCESLRALR